MISIAVVTKGPVAIAGSISNLFNTKGTNDPIVAANIIDIEMLRPTTRPNNGDVSINWNIAKIPKRRPYSNPSISPTRISFNKTFMEFSKLTRPVAKPLTIIVDDWVPTFPPIPIITGIKAARAMTFSNKLSKIPMINGKLSLIIDENDNLLNKKRLYNGPVDISRFYIKIMDAFGQIIDLNKMDFSFSIELEILYEKF